MFISSDVNSHWSQLLTISIIWKWQEGGCYCEARVGEGYRSLFQTCCERCFFVCLSRGWWFPLRRSLYMCEIIGCCTCAESFQTSCHCDSGLASQCSALHAFVTTLWWTFKVLLTLTKTLFYKTQFIYVSCKKTSDSGFCWPTLYYK